MYRLPSLNALRVFEVAARHLSFKLAAEELAVTPTAVSHQIRDLEECLGQCLFRRLPRRLELTPAGEALLPKVREGMSCLIAAVENLHALASAAGLALSAPPSFASRWLVPHLSGFTDAHPEVSLHMGSALRLVDDPAHGLPTFPPYDTTESGEAVVEIHFGIPEPRTGYVVEPVLAIDYVAVCAPRLLQGAAAIRTPQDLVRQPLIHDHTVPVEKLQPSWAAWCRAAGIPPELGPPGPHFRDSNLVFAAVADGLGVALLARQLIGTAVAAGLVAAPFDVTIPSAYRYYLVAPQGIAERREVRALRDWLQALSTTA